MLKTSVKVKSTLRHEAAVSGLSCESGRFRVWSEAVIGPRT